MSESRPANRWLLAVIPLAAIGLALLLFWPSAPDTGPAPVAPAPEPPPVVAAMPVMEAPEVPAAQPKVPTREEWEEDRDTEIPATDKCYEIMSLKWQGTHDFITLDLIRDRGHLYQMDDLACLSAEGANPAILDHVERYQDRRQFIEPDD